jgi:hypothetical protein
LYISRLRMSLFGAVYSLPALYISRFVGVNK